MKFTIILLLLSIQACDYWSDEEKRYNILSFFFDGVPLPESLADTTSINPDSLFLTDDEVISTEDEDTLKINKKIIQLYLHEPYKNKMCSECHSTSSSQSLQANITSLCGKCHGQFGISYKFIHGPVALGQCMECHHPHKTEYTHLLTREDDQLCLYCHSGFTHDQENSAGPSNLEQKVCFDCHNPHFSNENKFFIKN